MTSFELIEKRFPLLVASLENAKKNNRLAHAFLIQSDLPQTRENFAVMLAQLAACPENVNGAPCRKCRSCKQLEHGTYAELYTVNPEGKLYEIKVGATINPEQNTIRYFTERFFLSGTSGAARKIGIIYDADRMNAEAQNALLKTLEEPPRDTLIILTSGNPGVLLPTTLSRCQLITLPDDKIVFDFQNSAHLYEELWKAFNANGDIAVTESAAAQLIEFAGNLKNDAALRAEAEWGEKIKQAQDFDERLAKRLAKRQEDSANGGYTRIRQLFLSAFHSFYAQLYLLANGATRQDLANPELLAVVPPEAKINPEKALAAVKSVENMMFSFNFSVNEALAIRSCIFEIGS